MLKCWEETPEKRPTFSEITTMLTASISPQVLPTNPAKIPTSTDINMMAEYDEPSNYYDEVPDEDSTSKSFMRQEEDREDSLLQSIVSLLPPPSKESSTDSIWNGKEIENRSTSPTSENTDYYIEMSPVKRSYTAQRRTSSSSAHYSNQPVAKKLESSVHINRVSGDHCNKVESHSKPCVTLARNASNASDYFPMYPAQPARPRS